MNLLTKLLRPGTRASLLFSVATAFFQATAATAADATPPAAISTLTTVAANSDSATLVWLAPGDDGDAGTAASYDARYSTEPITEENWAAATPASNEPAPLPAGRIQVLTVGGLASGGTYYFALKTADEENNVSPLSNVASAMTTVIPPAAPAGLSAIAAATNAISLVWTDNATNEDSFQIERSTNGVVFTQVFVVGADRTNAVDTGLTADTTYHYRVRAALGAAVSPYSGIAQATTLPILDTNAPAAVTNLMVTAATSNRITLAWTAPGDDGDSGTASSYDVRYGIVPITEGNWAAATPATGEPAPAAAGSSEVFAVSGLASGVIYYFALRTADETNNVSPLSNVPSARTPAPGTLGAPSGLTATALSTNQIDLAWTDNADNEESFAIERSTNGTDFVQIQVLGANATNVADLGLSPDTTYHYRVRATRTAEASPYSLVVQATTLPVPPDTNAPAAVLDLAVSGLTTNSVTLIWTAPGDDGHAGTATRYDLRFATAPITEGNWASATPASGVPSPAAAGQSETFTASGLAAGVTYFFALRTADETNNLSPLSNVAIARTAEVSAPAAPAGLSATATATNRIDLAWIDNANNEDSFQVERSTNGVNFVQVHVTGANVTNVADLGLSPATTYHYRVRAARGPAVSPYSAAAQATTPATPPVISDTNAPAAVSDLAVTGITPNSVTLAWTAPGDDGHSGTAARYEVRYSTATITAANWATATPAGGAPIPAAAGIPQSCIVTGLAAGVTYHFALRTADEADNLSPLSNVPIARTPAPTAPAAPSGLSAVAVATNQIELTWTDNADNETSFQVERSINGVDFVPAYVVGANVTNVADSGLAPATTYHYRVRAASASAVSAFSDAAQATTPLMPPVVIDTNAPAAIADLAVAGLTSGSVTLVWTAPGDDGNSGMATRYEARYSPRPITEANWPAATPADGAPVPAAAGVAQVFTINGLTEQTNYYFALKAADEADNLSSLSNVPSVRTPPSPVPAAPTGLTATATATNRIDLAWADNADNEGRFEIERSTNGLDFVQVQIAGANVTNLTDLGLTPGTTYSYRVRAGNGRSVSGYSDIAQAATPSFILDTNAPAAVTNLAITSVGTNSATLVWTAPGDDGHSGTATRYDLRYHTVAINEALFAASVPVANLPAPLPAGSTQSVVVVGLSGGTRYYFALKTADETNNLSPLSNVPNAATLPNLPAAPTGLRATAVASNRIDLAWTDNASTEDGFKIECSADGVSFVQIATVGANVTNATDGGVLVGVTNFYRVRAYNVTGDSAYSNTNGARAIEPVPPVLTVLIASNSVWKYLDNGSDQGAAWRTPGFPDAAWTSGPAPLGYDIGEATTVSFGTNENFKHVTTYFRRKFTVADPSAFTALNLSVRRDDGAVVHLNGQEVFRSNMPTGAVTYLTFAAAGVTNPVDETFFPAPPISPALLVAGENIMAVEIHQRSRTSSDIAFDLALTASLRPLSLRLTIAVAPGGVVSLSWNAIPGKTYRVQYTADLSANNWINLGNDLTPTASPAVVTEAMGANRQRFYRVLLLD